MAYYYTNNTLQTAVLTVNSYVVKRQSIVNTIILTFTLCPTDFEALVTFYSLCPIIRELDFFTEFGSFMA